MVRSKIRHLPILVALYNWATTAGQRVVLEKKNSPSKLNGGGGNHRHIITAYAHAKNNTNTPICITLCTGSGLDCLAIHTA